MGERMKERKGAESLVMPCCFATCLRKQSVHSMIEAFQINVTSIHNGMEWNVRILFTYSILCSGVPLLSAKLFTFPTSELLQDFCVLV